MKKNNKETKKVAHTSEAKRAAAAHHQRMNDDVAFLRGPRSTDPLAEQLGEGFVSAATSGEESNSDDVVTEESGGPFIETDGSTEYAEGPDRSNPLDGTREPFPLT